MSKFTYPGVYVEELSSGVHSITGVATSIGAFVGWAPQGPTTQATLVDSWSDYEAVFGGLNANSYLGYSVNQFFANGGQQAYIVRLVWDGTLPPAPGTSPAASGTAVATGIGYATAQITASVGAIVSAPVPLNVGPAVLQGIAVTPGVLPLIPLGATMTFKATGQFSDGIPTPLGTVGWTSSDLGVVTITTGGVATAAGPGSATLTATSGLISGSVTVQVTAAGLASIAISPISPTLGSGATQQLAATGAYTDGTSRDLTSVVTWSSGNPAMATVDAKGLVTAGGTTGSPTINATWAGVSATDAVNVVAATTTGLSIHPGAPVAVVGQVVVFAATASLSDGTTVAPGTTAWSSSNLAVVTFAAGGKATAVAPGTATVTATANGLTASATLVVTAAALNAISITPVNATVAMGLDLPLKALGIYSDGTTADLTSSVDWTVPGGSNASVGVATGIVHGIAVDPGVPVTATWPTVVGGVVSNVTATANVAVTAAVVQSIAVTPASVAIASGGTVQLVATAKLSDGSTSVVTNTAAWNSSAPGVATVSATGLVAAVASGGSLTLFAANPGAWGNELLVSILPNVADPTRFGLLVQRQTTPGGPLQTLESFVNLSIVKTDPTFAVAVVDNDSEYISFLAPGSSTPVVLGAVPSPTTSPIALGGGADGAILVPASDQNFEIAMTSVATAGVFLLDRVDIFNLLCVPGETDGPTIQTLQGYCAAKRAFYIVDAPPLATYKSLNASGPVGSTSGSITGVNAKNSAYYFPWVEAPDPLFGNRPTSFPPCGFVAGLYAATDASRGVWKAPAGIQASLTGVSGLQYNLTDIENGDLNIQAINCLREFKVYGDVVWGARTLQGNDQAGSEWKYVPIRRLALFLESSLYDGTQWVVFEPNDVPLWGQIRLNVGAFMQGLFLQGAFQGSSPQQAYFVKCDSENNPQSSIDLGVVNIKVGFAPLYPAEFVVIQIQQMAGQLA